ncbi:MAG: hypothetical protein LBE89_08225 [Helicobacteraceae bacterium]|nr:hypothetical protein [Helicobacteraceae bacterium]
MATQKDGRFETFPAVREYSELLEAQNKRLARATLTGKISSLHDAATLFEFVEKTQQNFSDLQKKLVERLFNENLSNAVSSAAIRSRSAIDVLNRCLYERSSDVAFLAADGDLIDFLSLENPSKTDREAIRKRLKEYASCYTVYKDIVLLRPDGRIAARLDERFGIGKSRDSFIEETLSKNGYVEVLKESDLFIDRKKELIFAKRAANGARIVGVLALVFDFDGEMNAIFEFLNSRIALVDSRKHVIASCAPAQTDDIFGFNLEKPYMITKFGNKTFICAGAKAESFEGYTGLDWTAYAFTHSSDDQVGEARSAGQFSALLSAELRQIVDASEEIGEDLGDVVINGELIASKTRAYALNPILENIRQIGEQTRAVFRRAVVDLENVVAAALFTASSLLARLSLNIADRNLYERAADCRWWAKNPLFRKEQYEEASGVLERINSLYAPYSLLYIYDRHGIVRAVSKREAADFVGKPLADETHREVLRNADMNRYFVTPFAPNELYGGKPTYVYQASILSEANAPIGGIGLVFDAARQFEAILRTTLPPSGNEEDGTGQAAFGVFFDNVKNIVIASTNRGLAPLERLPFDLAALGESKTSLFEWDGRQYIVARADSDGYREYKRTDGYANNLSSLIFMPV